VVTDFGADSPFGPAAQKLKEHYGVALPVSPIRRITEGPAEAIFEQHELEAVWPQRAGQDTWVAERDGGRVPVVEPDPTQRDRRKGKHLKWQEAKICRVHPLGSTPSVYGGTLEGGAEEAGRPLLHCAVKAGWGTRTHIHAVGDGAPWIADQVAERFGAQGAYLLDFYHACEYLAAAAKRCDPDPDAWRARQKANLKANRSDEVLSSLEPHREPATMADTEAPVRSGYRYVSNRLPQLDDQGALQQGWPIGSGAIESSHRYIVQQRLKRPGAGWLPRNAEHMLALRLNRANHRWETYWQRCIQQAA
jgi:hypothetical protein